MRFWTDSFEDGAHIPTRLAMGKHDPDTHATFAANRSPHLAWENLPAGTRSLALLCVDDQVPTVGDDVNQEGKTVPADLPRCDFYHWVLVDLDPAKGPIPEGAFSEGVSNGGKQGPAGPLGTRQGTNNFTQWFGDDATMGGHYFGYDGPFPPWNDALVHHYLFTLYALDVDSLGVDGTFDGGAVQAAIEGHVLDTASFHGYYAINPDAGD